MAVSGVNPTSQVTTIQQNNNDDKTNSNTNVNMKTEKSEAYKKALKTLQANKEAKLAEIDEQIKAPKTTNEVRAKLEAKKAEFIKIYDNTNYKIDNEGNITFSFVPNASNINVESFKEAYGIKDGQLREYLKGRHDTQVANNITRPEGTSTTEEAEEARTNYNATDNGTITYDDGYEESKRSNWRGKIIDMPNYSKMTLGYGDSFTLNSPCFK